MTQRDLNIAFADTALERAFKALNRTNSSSHKRLARAIADALRELRLRHQEGAALQDHEIPEFYRQRHGVSRVQRLDIPPHWRAFYQVREGTILLIDLTTDGFT